MSTASIEGLVGAVYISHPPVQMVPFFAGGWLISTASRDLYYWRLSYAPANTVKLKIA
jgi:hypothetical protein